MPIGGITVKTRIDNGKPRDDDGNVWTDNQTVTITDVGRLWGKGVSGKGFDVFFAKQLLVEVHSLDRGTIEMEFDIPADASEIQKGCGIKRR
jgi:hypothetical protein